MTGTGNGPGSGEAGAPGVTAVSTSPVHGIGKVLRPEVRLVAGLGVEGDAHAGATVRHRSRVRRDPVQPNLRQVHLIAAELHDELAAAGFPVAAGELGENVTTRGLDLVGLPRGATLRLGDEAVVEVTGLRNPCGQIDGLHRGLRRAVAGRDAQGDVVLRGGVMAVVVAGGVVRAGDAVEVSLPPGGHVPLGRV